MSRLFIGARSIPAVVLIAVAGLLTACELSLYLQADGDSPVGDSEPLGDSIPSGDFDAGDSDAMGDAGSPGDPPPATDPCATQVQALASAMAEAGEGCAAVVRFSLFERELLGFQLLCGPYQTIDEEQARKVALSDSGCGYGGVRVISPSEPDAFVFYVPALDAGCSATVSRETGLTVFGGTFVWQGYGDITYPTAWRDPSELGSTCEAQAVPASVSGYNLVIGEDLAGYKIDAALADIADTALPDALALRGELRSAVILEYPRKLGLYEGRTAEWIVILNGGQAR